jgi:phosphatidylglycerophosphatase A
MPAISRLIAQALSTSCGLADRLPAPGTTAGSLPAAIGWTLAMAVIPEAGHRLAATLIACSSVVIVGVWAAGVEARRRGAKDPRPIVIDEVAGQWLTFVPALLVADISSIKALIAVAAAGFILFRVADVIKPWPVSRLEDLPGGIGIMADDLAAAVYAGLPLIALAVWIG